MAPMEATMSDIRPARFRAALRLRGLRLFAPVRGFLALGNRRPGVSLRAGPRIGLLRPRSVVLAITARDRLCIAGTVPGVVAIERQCALQTRRHG